MAPLWRLANDVLAASEAADGKDPAGGAATAATPSTQAASAFLTLLDSDREAAAAAATVLPDRVLTISYSSTVVEAIRIRRPQQTVCMRSEPGGEGWRVAEETRDCTWPIVMEDEEAMEKLPCEAILVGADAVTPGGMVNKVKTRALAEAARARGIPRYAVAGEAKFIGAALPLEASFEVTPLELFTSVAVPGSLLRPDEARGRAQATALLPELERLLQRLAG
jgi:translation initiation factor 2B subunit (eIF-2B alpha/beta/delta family)